MKNLILAALIAGASVSSVAAMSAGQLSEVDRIEAQRLVPSADLSNLTPAQVTAIEFLLTSDNLKAGNNPAGKLQVILNRS